MGAIEDTRKILQDFLSPELRAISVRLDALEKRFDESDKRQEKFADTVDKRFDNAERQAERRHEMLVLSLNSLANYNEVRERLTKLESKEIVAQ